MGDRSEGSTFGFWKKVSAFLLILCVLGFLLAALLHVRFVDVLFFEGLAVFALGGYFASGMANPKTVDIRTTTADPEYYREFLEDQRPKQISIGVILMIIGGILMVLAPVIGTIAH